MGDSCEIRPLHKMRRILLEISNEGRRRNLVHGLMQINITRSRRMIATMKAGGKEPPSMTGFIISCLAHALDKHRELQAFRRGNRLYIFDDIDVSTVIERDTSDGVSVPASIIIRGANRKDLREIHAEIRSAEAGALRGTLLGETEQAKRTNLFLMLPPWLRKPIWWWARLSPRFKKQNMGTVHVTAVGMFADGFDAGWAIPVAPWPLILTVGTISRRLQRSESGDLEDGELLNLTLTVDHDVVDGAPATRFLVEFKNRLESGYGLDGFHGVST